MGVLHGKRRTVCLVDDDPSILEIYKTKLVDSGFDVITGTNGKEGLEAVKKHKPDIALVDLMMPEKDGISMIHDMQKDPELGAIPVVVLTNMDDDATLKKIEQLQTRFYMIKSFANPQKVVGIVEEVLHNA